ncbi:unnamed protein product, partial [Discosporangium mesarthrocarpum]
GIKSWRAGERGDCVCVAEIESGGAGIVGGFHAVNGLVGEGTLALFFLPPSTVLVSPQCAAFGSVRLLTGLLCLCQHYFYYSCSTTEKNRRNDVLHITSLL